MKEEYSIAKENTLKGRLFRFFLWVFVAPIIRLIWIKKVQGLQNLPKSGPYIVAANHQSFLDFITLVCIFPERLVFLAAEKFYTSGFWRPIMEYTGQIKVEREAEDKSGVINKGLEVLGQGMVLALFPQGTRSRSGEIEKTYTGVARFALGANVPVIPVGIKGAFRVMAPNEKTPKVKKAIEINIGAPIDLSRHKAGLPGPLVYRQATNEVMRKIAELAGKDYKDE